MSTPASAPPRPILIRHAESAMTGTMVCAAVIAASAGHIDSIRSLEIAIVVTVGSYWLVHLYAATLALIINDRHHPWLALRQAVRHTWLSVGASLLPVGVLVISDRLGAEISTSALIALAVTVGLLAVYGGIAGRMAGFAPFGVVVASLLGALFGLLLVLVKVAVH